MISDTWTDELRQFVREQYGTKSVPEIAAICTERRGRPFNKNVNCHRLMAMVCDGGSN